MESLTIEKAHLDLVLPFLLSLWMAGYDIRYKRIPNYLNFGCALGGLGYQLGAHGWAGGADALLGIGLGFALLIVFYNMGGMGAGDVKALAALGAWLGPLQTLYLFCYMAIAGVPLIVAVLWWRGLLWLKIRQLWGVLINWVLLRPHISLAGSSAPRILNKGESIPYAVALAMGMAFFCWTGWN
jgi:prepilin peptidase CpaA